ncbi:hypothetical protein N7460_001413 [Penicillium canescens]|uniref:Uncharacterized protein n=1 Tax=Penicillium canescens TaxID=5083 RepID=A0AAD6NBN6_PENCN|nr:hypothetical protein N7460_001413 [Penicillium canescens]
MQLFKRKSPSNARTHHSVRSTEHLADHPQDSSVSSLGRSNTQKLSRDRPTVSLRPPSVSFKGKPISNPISNPSSPRVAHPDDESEVVAQFRPHSENPSPSNEDRDQLILLIRITTGHSRSYPASQLPSSDLSPTWTRRDTKPIDPSPPGTGIALPAPISLRAAFPRDIS